MMRFFKSGAAVIITLGVLFSVIIIGFNVVFCGDFQYRRTVYTPSQISNSTAPLVNINTATKDELKTLENIGDELAQKIIDYRKSSGGFKSTDELQNVKGIGEKTYDKIKYYISVS